MSRLLFACLASFEFLCLLHTGFDQSEKRVFLGENVAIIVP